MTEITRFLDAVRNGEPGAHDSLLTAVYDNLRKIATNRLARESGNQTLHPTDLVHEAWIRMGGDEAITWENRRHFFGAAAEAMRRTLVENARRKKSKKRGGAHAKQTLLDRHEPFTLPLVDELLDLNDALEAFEKVEPQKALVVKLKFFGGMTIDEIAAMTELSPASVERYWAYARVWLHQHIHPEEH